MSIGIQVQHPQQLSPVSALSLQERMPVAPTTVQPFIQEDYLREVRSIIDLISGTPIPLLCLDETKIGTRLAEFRSLLPGAQGVYDMARLDDPLAVAAVASLGCPLAASSAYHLNLADELGLGASIARLGSPVHHTDTLEAAVKAKPSVLCVDSIEGIQRLVRHGLSPSNDYKPTLSVYVKTMAQQPYANPLKVQHIIAAAQRAGFSSISLTAVVDRDHDQLSSYRSALQACTFGIQIAQKHKLEITGVHIAGGFTDPATLAEKGQDPTAFLALLGAELAAFQSDMALKTKRSPIPVSIDMGRWLIGEYAVVGQVTGTRTVKNQREVFNMVSLYGDVSDAAHTDKEVTAVAVPRSPEVKEPFLPAVETVVQCVSCDSVDKLPGTHPLPQNLSAGIGTTPADWIAYPRTGADSVSNAVQFNMIETAGVVLFNSTSGNLQHQQSPLFNKLRLLLDEAQAWEKSLNASNQLGLRLGDIVARDKIAAAESNATQPPKQMIKFREGKSLADTHLKFARSVLDGRAGVLAPTGSFLMQDGVQVIATIDYLLKELGVDVLCIAQKAQNDPTVVALEFQYNRHIENGTTSGQPRVWGDTASAGEMELARMLGCEPRHMIVSHPHKTQATLELMKEYRPWAWTFDGEEELHRVIQAGAGRVPDEGYEPTAVVRLKARPPQANNLGANVTNDLSAKFGCDENEAVRLLELAKKEGISKFGLSFHVGTQCCDAENYRTALDSTLRVIARAKELGIEVSVVDIGGGFPDTRKALEMGTTQADVIRKVGAVVAAFREHVRTLTGGDIFIVAEPGRIITDRGTIVTPVLKCYVSDKNETMTSIVIGDSKRQGLSGASHDAQNWDLRAVPRAKNEDGKLPPLSHRGRLSARVFGPTAFPSDEFIHRTEGPYQIPANLAEGDHIAVYATGSYSFSAGAIVGGLEPPGVILMLPTGATRSPWFSKNEIFLRELRRYINDRKELSGPAERPVA